MTRRTVERVAADLATAPRRHDWAEGPRLIAGAYRRQCLRGGCGWLWTGGRPEPETACRGTDAA